jgi:hypothetical protein
MAAFSASGVHTVEGRDRVPAEPPDDRPPDRPDRPGGLGGLGWRALAAGAESAACLGARVRRARVLHPRGVLCTGELTVDGDEPGADLLERPGRYPATIRLSKAAGTPGDLPDVLGLACRIRVAEDPPRMLDLLLSSTGARPVARHVLTPRRDYLRAFYSSLLPYRAGGRQVFLAARPLPAGRTAPAGPDRLRAVLTAAPIRFELLVAEARTPWRRVGTLVTGTVQDEDADRDLYFDVVRNSLPGLRPAGRLQALRGPAYRGSRRGRRAPEDGQEQHDLR